MSEEKTDPQVEAKVAFKARMVEKVREQVPELGEEDVEGLAFFLLTTAEKQLGGSHETYPSYDVDIEVRGDHFAVFPTNIFTALVQDTGSLLQAWSHKDHEGELELNGVHYLPSENRVARHNDEKEEEFTVMHFKIKRAGPAATAASLARLLSMCMAAAKANAQPPQVVYGAIKRGIAEALETIPAEHLKLDVVKVKGGFRLAPRDLCAALIAMGYPYEEAILHVDVDEGVIGDKKYTLAPDGRLKSEAVKKIIDPSAGKNVIAPDHESVARPPGDIILP